MSGRAVRWLVEPDLTDLRLPHSLILQWAMVKAAAAARRAGNSIEVIAHAASSQ
jgi:hypothetical protein